MHLGIVVVYAVPPAYERMLDLHLRQIDRHTAVPHTIFGCLVRASEAAADRLRTHPRVGLLAGVPTTARGSGEHSHYLDQLASAAIDAGVTHVVTLHVDSFPIHGDWVGRLVGRVSSQCPVVTGAGVHSSCLLFEREFYLRTRPAFAPDDEVCGEPRFQACVRERGFVQHSGVGLAVQACLEGRSVALLTPEPVPGSVATIYDNCVFHLGGGLKSIPAEGEESQAYRLARGGALRAAGRIVRAIVPSRVRQVMRERLGRELMAQYNINRAESSRVRTRREMERALADPDTYLASVLAAVRPPGAGATTARS